MSAIAYDREALLAMRPRLETRLAGQTRFLKDVTPDIEARDELLEQSPVVTRPLHIEGNAEHQLFDYLYFVAPRSNEVKGSIEVNYQSLVETIAQLGENGVPVMVEALRLIYQTNPRAAVQHQKLFEAIDGALGWVLPAARPGTTNRSNELTMEWSARFADLARANDPSDALRHLFARVEELVEQGEFSAVDSLLQNVVAASLPVELWIGILRIVFPFRSQLLSWRESLRIVRANLSKIGVNADRVLAGLDR